MTDTGRPLYDDVTEHDILGAILGNSDLLDDSGLVKEDFYQTHHQLIFQAMADLSKEKGGFDIVSVHAKLRGNEIYKMHPAILSGMLKDASFGEYIKHHVETLKELGRLRGLHRLAQEMEMLVSSGQESNKIAAAVEQQIDALYSKQMGGKWASMQEVTQTTIERIDDARSGKTLIGIPTGLKALDTMLGGLQKSDLIIVAGRPSQGKTSLALQFADSAAKKGFKAGVVSLEMSNTQVTNRLLAMNAEGLTVESLQRGTLTPLGWTSLATSAMCVSNLPIYLCDDSACTLAEIKAKAKTLQRTVGLDLLIVDYLQLMESDSHSRSREGDISQISRGLKGLAKRLDIPVVALSQLSRECEKRPDKRPLMSDLRESGAIEQDADIVLMVYRDEVYDEGTADRGIAELLIRKHRNGPVGDVRVGWDGPKTLFTNEGEGKNGN